MATHEFGIMKKPPTKGERYDVYEPNQYECLSVDDDNIEPLLGALFEVKCYWHTLDVLGQGLAYCGITLIPPQSLDEIMGVIEMQKELMNLKRLLEQAKKKGCYVIHFGI